MVPRSARSAKSGSASDDAPSSTDSLKVYGVLSQPDQAAGDAVPAPSSGPLAFVDHVNAPDNPQKYYLVFRNASAGQGPSMVDADFTASFE